MRDLGKRLERLEAISGAHVPRHEIAIHFVDPGKRGIEPDEAEIGRVRISRRAAESLEQFTRRAFAIESDASVVLALLSQSDFKK